MYYYFQHLSGKVLKTCLILKCSQMNIKLPPILPLEPHDGEHEAVRLNLQQQMVHRDLHYSVPQQEGFV